MDSTHAFGVVMTLPWNRVRSPESMPPENKTFCEYATRPLYTGELNFYYLIICKNRWYGSCQRS